MLDDLILDHAQKKSLYIQIVDGIKELIDSGRLSPETKLPSIREFSKAFSVSKTTVEIGYQILAAEGYIESRYKRGYYVADLEAGRKLIPSLPASIPETKKFTGFDFGSYSIDERYFDLLNWKRHVNYVLKDEKTLTRYGDSQGELELRLAVSKYLKEYRGVYANPDEIVIGAGFQSLLHLLIPLIQEYGRQVLFPEAGFPIAEAVFSQYGYKVAYYKSLYGNSHKNCLQYIKPGDYDLASFKDRLAFLEDIRQKNILLIEDDYNGEFRWGRRPLPALRSLDKFDNIIYFGAFSGILAPSIRVSYLILPRKMFSSLNVLLQTYTQTSSTIEQLALAKFINNGFLAKQVRRMRKGYASKRDVLLKALNNYFPNNHTVLDTLSTVELRVGFSLDSKDLYTKALKAGIRLKETAADSEFIFIFAGTSEDDISRGIMKLAKAWS